MAHISKEIIAGNINVERAISTQSVVFGFVWFIAQTDLPEIGIGKDIRLKSMTSTVAMS